MQEEMNQKSDPRFAELPALPIPPDVLNSFVKMTASPHSNESLAAIVARKQNEIERDGVVLWPFSASEASAKEILHFMEGHGCCWVFFNEGKGTRSKNAAESLYARSCTQVGYDLRAPLPHGVTGKISPSRKNSTYALVIDTLYEIPEGEGMVRYDGKDKILRTFTGIEIFNRNGLYRHPDKKLHLILAAKLKKPYLIRLSLAEPDTDVPLFGASIAKGRAAKANLHPPFHEF